MINTITLKNLSQEQIADLLPDGLILLGYRGSIAHRMYVPSSNPDSIDDKDIMGVYVGPIDHYLGFGRDEVKERFIGEWDAVSYEVRKFIRLLLNSNPNVLSLLWLPEKHLIYSHPLGLHLRSEKDIFVSKEAYHSFTGYAQGQFKRMTHFNREAQSEMDEYESILLEAGLNLDDICADQTLRDQIIVGGKYVNATIGEIIQRYERLRKQYYSGGYMGTKRRELVRRFGYDSKNAAHLIRLLRMGVEFLQSGQLQVEREDAEELLSIKRGEWPLESVKAEAEKLFRVAEEAYSRSTLPESPDRNRVEKLCAEIIGSFHHLSLQ